MHLVMPNSLVRVSPDSVTSRQNLLALPPHRSFLSPSSTEPQWFSMILPSCLLQTAVGGWPGPPPALCKVRAHLEVDRPGLLVSVLCVVCSASSLLTCDKLQALRMLDSFTLSQVFSCLSGIFSNELNIPTLETGL